MIRIDLPALVERLNPVARNALENAAASSLNQQATEITVGHFLYQLLDTPLCDLRLIFGQLGVNIDSLRQSLLNQPVDHAPYPQSYPSFSPLLVEWLQDSWLLASIELKHENLRSGVLLLGLLHHRHRYLPVEISYRLDELNREQIAKDFIALTQDSAEMPMVKTQEESTPSSVKNGSPDGSLLSRFTLNVTEQARTGKLDPVLCRDAEIDLMIDILCRRRKNNPIVVGEAGVGKSALIEGLALRIIANQVPEKIQGSELLSLDLGAMQAGASVKGEFEKRFRGLMQEVLEAEHSIILFIDEAHTLIGAGNQQGGLDVSNLLKPALARGELKTIAATTWHEYKKYIEKDAALSRRFQIVQVKEPSIEQATIILRGLQSRYEEAHGVLINEDAIQAAAQLSARYLSGRQLPDKAIDVLDTACARCAINMTTPPRNISALQTQLCECQLEISNIEREQRIGLNDHSSRLSDLYQLQQVLKNELDEQHAAWQKQQALVIDIIQQRQAILAGESTPQLAENLVRLEHELAELQSQNVSVSPHVDRLLIASVIAEWTGVPLNQISRSELKVITELPDFLGEDIKGQSLALSHLHRHLLTARADLRKTGRPLGAFLLVGPSGVGKTETVLRIADLLFGGRAWLTSINMSEFQEKHTVSRLIGSPPGYVGYGEGGILTEAIRQKPYSVVLLDEVEKAHPDVLNLFYQAFDKGELADGEGRIIDCKNIVFFLTSNLGYQVIDELHHRPEEIQDALYPEIAAFFKPALLARMEVIPYLPLSPDVLREIVANKLAHLNKTLAERFHAEVVIDEEVHEEILQRAHRKENGARMLESVIDGVLLPPVSLVLLQRLASGEAITKIHFGVKSGEFSIEVDS
ncbi:type VI secretion system ATPase TssH [Hafnia alvei]|uniref:type VI secretion system ATPase TssH n=1 Tax=Hafnia alvei TaxID=569 RepID=UPI000E0FE6CD|nr:type VI secretion system ATPase TssH [Hafnia alvei]